MKFTSNLYDFVDLDHLNVANVSGVMLEIKKLVAQTDLEFVQMEPFVMKMQSVSNLLD